MYKRRDITSLAGPLYEMKLISLLYLRAFSDDTIEEYQLAANVDHMDLFGNICFKAKVKGIDKPVAAFIQVKYRPKKNITYISHLEKSFCSYLKIRQQFDPNNDNLFLQGEYNETECFFVLYSNAIINFKTVVHDPRESAILVKLKDLIGTGGSDEQIYDQQNVDFLCEVAIKKQMISLAEQIAGLLNHDANFKMLLADEIMQLYHVILAQKAIKVSEIQPDGHRIAFFRSEFFDTHEEYLIIFRDALYKAVQINKDISEQNKNELIELLQYHRFKVPAAFGNKDLTIRGDDAKIEKRLNYLASNIYKLFEDCNTSGKDTIVTVDDSLAEGFLQLNGGIAGTIGNIFVLDINSKLMKITDSTEQLEPLAKRLYIKIMNEVPNLHEYKFNFKVNKFPKLSFNFDQHEKQLARDFLNRLVLYYNQGDMYNVECILENEIENYQCVQPTSFQAKTNVAFLRYCDHIQKWWMSPENATVLTRETDLLEISINNIEDILMSEINANYMSKIKQYNYTFTESAVRSLKLQKHSNTIIITENSILTVVKVIQHLNDKDYVVLNFEYIANLPTNDRTALRRELEYTNYDKVLILVCDDIQKEKMNTLGIFTVRNTNVMIVTNQTSFEAVQKYFPAYIILHDKKFCLIDLSEESQIRIFKTATVIFPGVEEEIKLDLLLTKPASRSCHRLVSQLPEVFVPSASRSASNPNFIIQTATAAMTPIETYVFFDLEATGLIKENNVPGITELGMLAVKRRHLLTTKADDELRVQYKFRMCFNPNKPMSEKSIELSGFTNELLDQEAELNAEAFNAISSFINCLQKPVCLIAHNGFTYHFPVLIYHLKKIFHQLSSDVLCTDSLYAFHDLMQAEIRGNVEEEMFEKESKKEKSFEELKRARFYSPDSAPGTSYQLKDIYQREFVDAHLQGNRAENHCVMMFKIALSRAERFSRWVAANHCRLHLVPVPTESKENALSIRPRIAKPSFLKKENKN